MTNKDYYSVSEIEEMFEVFRMYQEICEGYEFNVKYTEIVLKNANPEKFLEKAKNKVNDLVKECNEKIPKSLIDKLGIKKVE